VREMDAYDAYLNSLIPTKNSLFLEIFSLLIFAGNLPRSGCGTGVFCSEIACKSVEIAKFPVNFPVSRELQVETGSYLTAHTTIQSPQTARFPHDVKQGVSAGTFGHPIPGLWSLCTSARLSGDFWRSVSASKNSVPGGRPRAPIPTAFAAAIAIFEPT
jgi:hypothetical protein